MHRARPGKKFQHRYSLWVRDLNETNAYLFYWMYWLSVVLLVTTEVAFVTSTGSHKVLATIRGKVIYWRDANPCQGGKCQCQKPQVPVAIKGINLLAKDLVPFFIASFIMY